MSTYYFLKLKSDFFDSPEIKVICSLENGPAYVIIYEKLLLLSLKGEEPGCVRFKPGRPYSDRILSTVLSVDIDLLRGAMKAFTELGLATIDSEGTILLEDGVRLAGKDNTSTERVRLFRERQKQKLLAAQANSKGTEEADPEADEKAALHETFQCNTELELELEKEGESKEPSVPLSDNSPKRKRTQKSNEQASLTTFFFERYVAVMGTKPAWGAKEGALLKGDLARLGAERLRQLIERFFGDCPPEVERFAGKAGRGYNVFHSQIDQLLADARNTGDRLRLLRACPSCGKQQEHTGLDCIGCGKPLKEAAGVS